MVSAFSIPKATRGICACELESKRVSLPGPATYDSALKSQTIIKNYPKYSFGHEQRTRAETLSPGPGSYQLHSKFQDARNPKYSILGRHQEIQPKYNISPGHYSPSPQNVQLKSPSFSMLGKKGEKIFHTPGPAHYKSKSFIEKRSGYDFGKQQRLRMSKQRTPSSGDYDYLEASIKYNSKEQPHYKFAGKTIQKYNNFPGPGQYQPKPQIFSKIGGLVSLPLNESTVNQRMPGPGAYNTNTSTTLGSPKWSLPKQKRMELNKKYSLGPGGYDDMRSYKIVVEKTPAYGFGGSQKMKCNSTKAPGPGSYNSFIDYSRKSIKIGQKQEIDYDNKIPGPGTYESIKYDDWLKGKGRYTLAKQARLAMRDSRIPGPGTYAVTSPLRSQVKKSNFGKEQRMRDPKYCTPGPGNYQIKPTFADVPKYLLP